MHKSVSKWKNLSDEVRTLYRCQRSSEYEIADLLVAYRQHSPVVINTFFSTSRKKQTALWFLDRTRPKDMNYVQIVFTITASKQKASPDSPFADISKISQFSGEDEILFVPGQMFYIDKIDMRLEEEIKVYSIEMSLQDKCQERIEPLHRTFQIMLEKHANDPLLCFAAFLVTSGKVSPEDGR
ncbi:unnamed protein product [Adineta ricciae]|uniref:NAD(+)--protein-arginine ADP-ribosyltransferase n=1 Tax=Adineta ricciae TaxID=249248 RepID=A0A815SN61_ADIRI|nr:unnamed protein product [Adineta ricciae]